MNVQWTQPQGGATVTGYVVHYHNNNTEESLNVTASTNSIDIGNLTRCATYTVWVEATSDHLSGVSDVKTLSEDIDIFCLLL